MEAEEISDALLLFFAGDGNEAKAFVVGGVAVPEILADREAAL